MFPLNCARFRAHTGRERSKRKKTWSAHKCSLEKCFAHISHVIPNSDDFKSNVGQKKFYAHTDIKKLEGTLIII